MEPTQSEPKNEAKAYPMHEPQHCYCRGCHRGGWFVRVIRTLVWFVILMVVLSLAVACFVIGIFGHGMGSYSIRSVPVKNGFMMQWRNSDDDSARIFGIITRVSGATITIIDNGGAARTITSTANTMIYDLESELSIRDLRIGDRIVVTGVMGDRTFAATAIEVSGHAK